MRSPSAQFWTPLAQLLNEGGFAALTIDEVARRASVGKSTIYRRWPTKGTLAFEAFRGEMLAKQPLADTGNLRGDLFATLRSWIRAVKGTDTGRTLVELISEVHGDSELAAVWAERFVTPVRSQHRLLVRSGDRTWRDCVPPSMLTSPSICSSGLRTYAFYKATSTSMTDLPTRSLTPSWMGYPATPTARKTPPFGHR